jgi:hypothetical protein
VKSIVLKVAAVDFTVTGTLKTPCTIGIPEKVPVIGSNRIPLGRSDVLTKKNAGDWLRTSVMGVMFVNCMMENAVAAGEVS